MINASKSTPLTKPAPRPPVASGGVLQLSHKLKGPPPLCDPGPAMPDPLGLRNLVSQVGERRDERVRLRRKNHDDLLP